ncbi:MAG TPA: hypothetical protein VES92_06840, partial [Nitrospiraceae bacterium]|nr:hypothetical protein [Nitrospiraceae bacterium]
PSTSQVVWLDLACGRGQIIASLSTNLSELARGKIAYWAYRRYHRHYRSHGHIWQGRFKSFPIQQDAHLLTVLRYVVRNPVRAQLVESVTQWPWSSLHFID